MVNNSTVRVYNRIPLQYSSRGTPFGSNSELFEDVVSELSNRIDEIEEVHLAFYLFNNVHLYRELVDIANHGAKVVITSLPLSGYDRRKIAEAKKVYNRVLEEGKIKLNIFPHMYFWYGARYAGGGASYSFHIKAGYVKYKDGTGKVYLTSGNVAVSDPTHSETAIFIDVPKDCSLLSNYTSFFSEIERRGRSFQTYNKITEDVPQELQQIVDFAFVGGLDHQDIKTSRVEESFFTAPFITVESRGSNHFARERLVDVILSARKRLLVCTQHSHDVNPFDGYKGRTLIGSIMEAKKNHSIMDIRVLKQVTSSGLADKRRAAFVESHLFYAGIPQRVNRLVHDKFIIADDIVVVTSGNFTATQFGWGDRRMEFKSSSNDIKEVQKIIDISKEYFVLPENYVWARMTRPRKGTPKVNLFKNDVFSEINAFIIMESPEIANQVAEYFERLWSHKLSSDVEIPS